MYNFENYLLTPFYSLITGIFLIFSVGAIGFFFINYFFKNVTINNNSFYLNSPLIGSNLIIFFLTPIVYFELHSPILFKILSFILFIFFVFVIIKFHKNFTKFKFNKDHLFLYTILTLLFFLCISPVTHADSLAYHMLGGVNYFIKGPLLKELLPIEIKSVGSGELLIALGLSVGSEQFGTLIQFSSILTIIYVFLNINKSNKQISKLILIGVITTPVFLFLISSPKPQLMQITNSLFCSFLIFQIYKKKIPDNLVNYFVYLIVFLSVLNVLVKYSFILSSSFIGFILFLVLVNKKKGHLLILPILISFLLLVLPKYLFYLKYFDINFLTFLRSPLPINLAWYNEIHVTLKNIAEGNRFFPLWLIIPKNLGYGGTIIGPLVLSLFFFRIEKNIINLTVLSLCFLFVLLILIFGQATSRFIFEGFLIAQLFIILNNIKNKHFYKILKYYINFQASVAILLLIYSIGNLTPGAFSIKARTTVMKNNANGYEAMIWINDNLKDDEQIFSSHRSLGLINNKSYSLIFFNYLKEKDRNFIDFIDYFKKNNVKKAFVFDGFKSNIKEDCFKRKIETIENISINFGRNPFREKQKISAHIFELDLENLENCIN